MRENTFRKIQPDLFKSLALCFIDGHHVRDSNRKLLAYQLKPRVLSWLGDQPNSGNKVRTIVKLPWSVNDASLNAELAHLGSTPDLWLERHSEHNQAAMSD